MKTLSRFALVLALSLAITPAAFAGTWNIDPVHSEVDFKVRHLFSKTSGTFDTYQGQIEFDPAKPEKASVRVTIDAASINTKNEGRDGHLRSPDFFAVEEYPSITFESTKVTPKGDGMFMVDGNLTMRGVTKPVSFVAQFHGAGNHPMMEGHQVAGFSGELSVNRKDFGIVWNANMDKGGVVLGDEVEIELNIEAVSAPANG